LCLVGIGLVGPVAPAAEADSAHRARQAYGAVELHGGDVKAQNKRSRDDGGCGGGEEVRR